jgi:crossover junction endodeoxyribonuclease RuvC
LDPSLTATGVVVNGFDDSRPTDLVVRTPKRGTARLIHLRSVLLRLARAGVSGSVDLVVIEGPSYASSIGQAHSMGGLWWCYVVALAEFEIPVLVIPPTVLKKFATGAGNAGKDRVVSAVSVRTGREFSSNDIVDALVLYSIGRFMLGLPHPLGELPSTHRAALDKIELPEGVR